MKPCYIQHCALDVILNIWKSQKESVRKVIEASLFFLGEIVSPFLWSAYVDLKLQLIVCYICLN